MSFFYFSFENIPVNPFVPSAPFLYPMKTSENRKGVEKGYIGDEWVKSLPLVDTSALPNGICFIKEGHLAPSQLCMMEFFASIVNGW